MGHCARLINLNPIQATHAQQEPKPYSMHSSSPEFLAAVILSQFLRFRRMDDKHHHCTSKHCPACESPHISKVLKAVKQQTPVTFVLPAFPGKSPNTNKVIGHMPDMAETLALRFLNNLCESVKDYYHPGARIILCSDGRVFSDIIGMKEAHVSEYQRGIDHLIEEHKLSNLSTFSLDDLHGSRDFEFSRQALMETFGSSSEVLRERINRAAIGSTNAEDIEAQRMYCGITRFLVEDSFDPDQKLSKTALQKQCKKRALEVICRSNAWSELIAHTFDHAIRLSIHPQHCGSKKLGIQLLGEETWMTPWHGVAVNTKQGFTLMKRWEAQALNAELIIDDNGRPSHYQMQSLN